MNALKNVIVVLGSVAGLFALFMLVNKFVLDEGPYKFDADPDEEIFLALQTMDSKKYLLLVFGANWCGDCIELEHRMARPPLSDYLAEHFEVVRVNVEEYNHNMGTVERFGDPIAKGIPSFVVLSKNQEVLHVTSGGEFASMRNLPEGSLLAYLDNLLREFSAR